MLNYVEKSKELSLSFSSTFRLSTYQHPLLLLRKMNKDYSLFIL